MTSTSDCATATSAARERLRWWREYEFWTLLLLVVGVYFTRPTTLSLRGEESRWANIAREMLQSGDFIAPRQQGVVFANRPPLTNWCIALSMTLTGKFDTLTVRLPTLVSTLLTTLMLYALGRNLLSRTGALVAGAAYATMGQVLQLGRHAESEAVLTLFVTASLVGWLACYRRGAAPWIPWCVGYGFAALAGLAKGPQGPVYFFGATWLFCLLFDRAFWRRREHLYGLACFVAVLCIWQVPLIYTAGFRDAMRIWFAETTGHIAIAIPLATRLAHAATFPWEALGCMLPWSVLLFGYGHRSVRDALGDLRRPAQFLAIAMVIGLLPLLIAVHARGRYYMPLYPCAALLAAVVVEVCVVRATQRSLHLVWYRFLKGASLVVGGAALFIAAVSILPNWAEHPFAQPPAVVVGFSLAAVLTLWICRRAWTGESKLMTTRWAALSLAGFCGFAYTTVIVNALLARSGDPRHDVEKAIAKLPAEARLVSFTTIHHLFAFYVADVDGRTIERADPAATTATSNRAWEYFCINSTELPRQLPFQWEQVATVSVDRNYHEQPKEFVLIGRKLPAGEATAQEPSGKFVR
jgi:4-amino-4-deoxy-L-arabinose transferase-like glycosyltransferase